MRFLAMFAERNVLPIVLNATCANSKFRHKCTDMSTEELQIKRSPNESFFCPSCLKNIKNPIEFVNTLTKVSCLSGFKMIHYTQYH